MTNCFDVVGHHRDDPDHLLLRGDDGAFYACAVEDLPRSMPPTPTEPGEEWAIETPPGDGPGWD